MRAVVVEDHGSPDVLSVTEQTVSPLEPAEVRIEVAYAGLNFVDVEKRRGAYPSREAIHSPTPPYIPGLEAAGRVAEAGTDTEFESGDRVFTLVAPGCYCESVTVAADRVSRVPDGVDLQTASGMIVQFLTAHNTLFEWGELEAGETVLVHAGAGGVGTAALQLADRVDCTVYTTASSREKRELTRELGADRAVDYTTESIRAVAADELSEGFDLVLDGVGGRTFKRSLRALAPGGRLVTYGMASGDVPSVAAPRLLFENRSVVGYHLEHAMTHLSDRVASARESVVDGFERGELKLVTDESFPLKRAADAHRHLESRESIGKVLLEVNG